MATLEDIVSFLDGELRTTEVPDYPNALNGLQLCNRSGQLRHVVAAVDASLPVVRAATALGNDGGSLLLVHHGLFWQGLQPHTGASFEKLRIALEADLAIYSSHIPLDIHPQLGNNARLANAIGLQDAQPFFTWKGIELGLAGRFSGSRDALREILTKAVGSPVHLCPGGEEPAGRVGLITGGAGSEIAAIAAEKIDTFVTGEGPHWSFPLAEELGINVLYAGHYATETFGVRALASELAERFRLEHHFVDRPTGL